MTHFEIALLLGCLSSAASVLTAWHFHTKLAALLKQVEGTESNVINSVLSEVDILRSKAETDMITLHSRLNNDAAATLEALEKALEFFHLHSSALQTHVTDLKAHALNYQDRLALSVPKDRSVPTR